MSLLLFIWLDIKSLGSTSERTFVYQPSGLKLLYNDLVITPGPFGVNNRARQASLQGQKSRLNFFSNLTLVKLWWHFPYLTWQARSIDTYSFTDFKFFLRGSPFFFIWFTFLHVHDYTNVLKKGKIRLSKPSSQGRSAEGGEHRDSPLLHFLIFQVLSICLPPTFLSPILLKSLSQRTFYPPALPYPVFF